MFSYPLRRRREIRLMRGGVLLPAVVVFDTPDWKADTDEAAVADGFVVLDTGDYVIDDLAVTGLPLFVQGQNVYVEN